jgi:nitroreductase
MKKRAETAHPVLDVIAERWSPRAFDPRPVGPGALRSLFEAARWAASCFNEQPWAYIVVGRNDARFEEALACLAERNRLWARNAGALVFACARQRFERNDKPNRWASYDLGQATAHLALQAQTMGIVVHQMGGFSAERVHEVFGVPEGTDPIAAIAIGYPGRVEELDETFREKESAPRERKPQEEFVFESAWGRLSA